MTFGNRIATYRKQLGITQDALAHQLDVTNQAISKWESDQCCPDIQHLPKLADIFGITIDALFGRDPQPQNPTEINDLPWEDDGTLRVVLYVGKTLADHAASNSKKFLKFMGSVKDIESPFTVFCGDVQGNVSAGGNIKCSDVTGNVDAGGSITCGNVGGDVDAGNTVKCGNVAGNVDAGGFVTCGSVDGDVDAGSNVNCGDVAGNVDAGCDVNCGDVGGSVDAGKKVIIRK